MSKCVYATSAHFLWQILKILAGYPRAQSIPPESPRNTKATFGCFFISHHFLLLMVSSVKDKLGVE